MEQPHTIEAQPDMQKDDSSVGERFSRLAIVGAFLIAGLSTSGCSVAGAGSVKKQTHSGFTATTGNYTVRFQPSSGAITVKARGKPAALSIRELGGDPTLDLLYAVKTVRHSAAGYLLTGTVKWATFTALVGINPRMSGLIHLRLTVKPSGKSDIPTVQHARPDVQLIHAPAGSLKEYAAAPPVAGTSLLLSAAPLDSSILYLADYTSLGPYFDRTSSGATQSNFTYPRAGIKGSLLGAGSGYFGYEPPAGVDSLPAGKSTVVVDSYLYLVPGIPSDETTAADTYLKLVGGVFATLRAPSIPSADWKALAARSATDLTSRANLVTVNGRQFLRSYVSDTRMAPELITQAGVLAGVKAYEARYHQTLPIDALLEHNLSAFYDPTYHSVVNGVGHDLGATGESWYFVQNMISLLQAAENGSAEAKQLLLDSTDAVMALAHTNTYEFPQNFRYRDWKGGGTGLQPDVAGGYAWLMLGLFDLTHNAKYLDEAKSSIAHVAGKGFDLAYETHMTAYTAAAAQRLYTMTKDVSYRGYATLALANLFHATRLWDCTYGYCRKGRGYHTYFGLNPLPWSDYIAMLEQYEAWLGLRDYLQYAYDGPSYVRTLVQGFLTNSPLTLQYSLPPLLPAGAASSAAGEYPLVPHNNLGWNIPLEDLREGEATSGVIGQEIYGAGGPFMFAAYAP